MINEELKEQLIKQYNLQIHAMESLTILLREYSLTKEQFSKEDLMLLSEEDRETLRFNPEVCMNRFKIEMQRWLESLKTE